MADQLDRLLRIMARLRDPDNGCDWDKAQTFSTIAPYTIEEAYEVSDAIERGNMGDLTEELGDLLLQVVFHSRIAQEESLFDFQDVARSICDKMEARHPHIFDSDNFADQAHQNSIAGQPARWEELKAKERSDKGAKSAMDGVARALPAILRSDKLQKRAARDGFDWPDTQGPADKVIEEMAELAEAAPDMKAEEAGDLLFAAVNLVRAYGIAPEEALRDANDKFERRYRGMESLAKGEFSGLDLNAQEELWNKVKRAETDKNSN